MNVEKFIRLIQVTSVLIILTGAVMGFISEINLMIEKMKVELADLLLLFIYVEVMGMIRVYLLNEEIRITYPLIIAITAISRLIILQKKDLDIEYSCVGGTHLNSLGIKSIFDLKEILILVSQVFY